MKRKQEKQNNTKHSLKKLIALWIVFALLVVPFANHVSGRDDAKAEGETPTTSEEYYTAVLTESYSENDNGSLYKDNSGKYYLRFRSVENGYVNEAKTYVSDVIKLKTQVTLTNAEHAYAVDDATTAGAIFDTSNYDVKYVQAGNDPVSVYRASITEADSDFVSKDADLSSYTSGVAVYIKPTATKSQTGDAENLVGEALDAFNANMGYTLVGVYTFSKVTNPTIIWSATNKTDVDVDVTDSTTKYRSASLNVTGGNTMDTAGTWKYKYLKTDESGNAPGDASVKSTEGWGDSCPTLDKDTAGISDGIYYGYAGYFVNNADGTQTLLTYVSTATPVALDVTAPVVTISAEYKDGDSYKPITIDDIDTTYSSNPSEGIFYVLKSETIWFSIESDEDANISSSWGDLSVIENVPQYTNEFDVNTIQNNAPYSITVADNVGNETTASFTLDGRTIYFTNNYSKFRLEGATVKGVNGEQFFNTYDQYINEDWVTRYGGPSVEFTFLSDENIKAVTGKPTNKYEYQITGLTDVAEDVSFSRPYYTTKVSKTLEEGTYTIGLNMYDGNLESYSYGTIFYDKTPPVITQAELQHKNAAGVWEAVAQENIENGKYYVNYGEDLSNYRYFVAVNDGTGVGIDENSFTTPFEKVAEGEYQHILQASDLAKNMEEATDQDHDTVCVKDKIGNESGASFTIPVKQDKATTIEPELRADGTVIDLSDSSKFTTNKNMTLTVTAESSAHITGISVTGDVNGNAQSLTGTLVSVSDMDAKTKLYTVQYTFEIPNGTTLNQLLENGKINVTTEKDDKNAEYPFRTILYDHTEPILQSTNVTPEVDLSGLQVDWIKNYTLQYKIISGLGNVESPIAGAEYSISNAGDNNVGSTAIDVTGNAGMVEGSFDIPESVSVTGTTVYMKAKDEAGNEKDQSVNIKVDATKPEIADISVRGYVDAATPVVGAPVVHTSVSDNLTIKTAEMTITYPDGTTVKKVTAASGEGIDISKSLDYTFEADAPDGDYTIDVYVEDKAGNSNTKSMAFRLDNTAPVVTVKITDGTTAGKQPQTNFDGTTCDYYYGSDVTMLLTYEDTNISSKDVVVTDNGTKVNVTWTQVGNTNKYQANYVATTEGKHVLCINATDVAGNPAQEKTAEFIKDIKKPTMTLTVNGKSAWTEPIEGAVKVQTGVADNQTLNIAKITVVGPNAQAVKTLFDAGNQQVSKHDSGFALEDLIDNSVVDGDYAITVEVSDKAGNSDSTSIYFRVDNTVPVVTAKIADGVTAGKQPGVNFDGTDCDFFYRSDVAVLLTYEDNNMDASSVVVTDNGTPVAVQWTQVGTTNKYQAVYQVTKDGAHTIKIGATDKAGNKAEEKQIVFIRDTAAPVITAMINGGMVYNESMGVVDLTSNAVVSFSVNDTNEDVNDFNYQLIKTLPDENPVTADVLKTENRSFGFSDEADYVVKAYSVDKAGNRSAERTVQFRIDKTAPELNITGTASGSTLNAGTTLTFSMTEAFWRDASGTITITRKANDSTAESNYKTIDFKPTARVTTLTETLSETGEYKVTFTGKDRAGHTAEAATYTVRIDTGKPIITLSGVSNNDKTTKQVEFQAQIEEDFYLTKSVSIQATRTYLDPESYKEKTEDLQITGYNPTAATTLIRNTFTEDGIYKIQVTCKDAAGNEDTQEVSFTIDKTNPVIDPKVMSAYQGTLTSFAWDYDLNDIIYDLTVCDTHMYLNGSEYDGTSEVEDGAYEMKITAEDELGNATEETVNFNLDTKAPTFIVTGVEDGEIKNAQYDINVSLQLDEDTLDEVTLNGSAVEIKDNAATITVTEKGDYKLAMKAHDEAGNVAEKTISFTYGEKSHVLLYVLIGVGALVLLGGGAAIVVAAKKK